MFSRGVLSLLLFLITILSELCAQEIQVKGYFLEDSIKIGIKTPFVLVAAYPEDQDVVFPDSLFDFSPYELDDKWYAPTSTAKGLSYDSAIYYLLSYEIDSIQYHQMPVFQLVAGDSITYQTAPDSIMYYHVVTEIPDSITAENAPLKENTTYKRVSMAFNYPYLIIGLAIVFVIALIAILVFGKSIRKSFALRRLNKTHRQFLDRFETVYRSSKAEKEKAEALLVSWKKYLEKLENKPYTKSTTKEILVDHRSEPLENALRGLDKMIYSTVAGDQMDRSFSTLRDFSQQKFEAKIQEVKNG